MVQNLDFEALQIRRYCPSRIVQGTLAIEKGLDSHVSEGDWRSSSVDVEQELAAPRADGQEVFFECANIGAEIYRHNQIVLALDRQNVVALETNTVETSICISRDNVLLVLN